MLPVAKFVVGGALTILVCTVVIVPTVIVLQNKKDDGNATTTQATTFPSTSQTLANGTITTPQSNGSTITTSVTTSRGSTTSVTSTSTTSTTTSVTSTSTTSTTTITTRSTSTTASTTGTPTTTLAGSTSTGASTATPTTTLAGSTSTGASTATPGSTDTTRSTTTAPTTTSAVSTTTTESTFGPNTTITTTAIVTVTTAVNLTAFTSSFSSSLTNQNPFVCLFGGCAANTGNFYQAFRININATGQYSIISQSGLDTFGLLYSPVFDPRNLNLNLVTYDDDSNGIGQFRIVQQLDTSRTYNLVFTTYDIGATGAYSVVATGPSPISLTPINASYSRTTTFRTDTPTAISTSSSKFCRLGTTCSTPNYHYQSVVFNVTVAGTYQIGSNSSLDTVGFIYMNTFIPANATANILAGDDESGGNSQFLLSVVLSVGVRYIAVATTHYPNVFGSLGIFISGPGNIMLIS